MAYDVARIRSEFPSLDSGWAQFDGPGGTQTPRAVGEAVASVLTGPLSNRGTIGDPRSAPRRPCTGSALAMADLVNGHPRGIVHGRSATQLAYDFSRHLVARLGPRRRGRRDPARPRLERAPVGAGRRARRARRCAGSTSTRRPASSRPRPSRPRSPTAPGSSPSPRRPTSSARCPTSPRSRMPPTRSARCVYVDGVHHTAHELPDVDALGADFFIVLALQVPRPALRRARRRSPSCSRRSCPTSCCRRRTSCPSGSSSARCPTSCSPAPPRRSTCSPGSPGRPARRTRRMRDLASGPARGVVRGTARARGACCARASRQGLAELPGVDPLVARRRRTPTLLATFAGHEASEVTKRLAEAQVLAPSGNFYALEASRRLGLGDAGGLRVGLAPYTDADRGRSVARRTGTRRSPDAARLVGLGS